MGIMLVIVDAVKGIWNILNGQKARALNAVSDQPMLRILARLQEVVTKKHEIDIFLLEYVLYGEMSAELYCMKVAEGSALQAELRGLVIAVGDKELRDLLNVRYKYHNCSKEDGRAMVYEVDVRGKARRLHTRISQLIEEVTTSSMKRL